MCHLLLHTGDLLLFVGELNLLLLELLHAFLEAGDLLGELIFLGANLVELIAVIFFHLQLLLQFFKLLTVVSLFLLDLLMQCCDLVLLQL